MAGKRLALFLAAALVLPAAAQAPAGGPAPKMDLTADRLEYGESPESVIASGHVVVRYGGMEMRAERVIYYPRREEVEAEGAIVFQREGVTWSGGRARYNLRTGRLDTGEAEVAVPPFRIWARTSERLLGNRFVLRDVLISTCVLDRSHAHWHIRAREAVVTPDRRVEARGVTFYFGAVPVLYTPYWSKDAGEFEGFNLVPGYTSLMGAFLLSSYTYRLSRSLEATTHLDYRTRRGIAVGQDFEWANPARTWSGTLTGYYADDLEPLEAGEDPEVEGVENRRYRLGLSQAYDFSERTRLLTALNYLSDPDLLEDFFPGEYRYQSEPDNFMSLSYRADRFTAHALMRKRLNDFYTVVNRTPELSIEVARQALGSSPLYYEGKTSAGGLEKAWEARETNATGYASLRLDSAHMLYVPSRHFGFLNLIPRAGYRLTYYSRTLDPVGGGAAEGPAATRSIYELGLQTSFKAFRAWSADGAWLDGLRHIAEPYADYTYVPEPSLLPAQLYAFDEVDTLDRRNELRVGMRNKLQTRRDGSVVDLVDLDAYATYHVDSAGIEENTLGDIALDGELRPVSWCDLDFDARYDPQASKVEEFNTELGLRGGRERRIALGYRHRDSGLERSRLLSASASGLLNESRISCWHLGAGVRYELEGGRLEEHSYSLERRMDCMTVMAGFSHIPAYETADGTRRDDEFRIWLELWLTAFPRVGASVGR